MKEAGVVTMCGQCLRAGVVLVLGLALAAGVLADDVEDVDRLHQQRWELIRTRKYADAEQLAIRLQRLAAERLASQPTRLANALYASGKVSWYQGRYAEAEQVADRAIAILDHAAAAADLRCRCLWSRAEVRWALDRCEGAVAEKAGKKPDYAEALHKAKLWVRNNPEHRNWQSPYYWGAFVLVGPN